MTNAEKILALLDDRLTSNVDLTLSLLHRRGESPSAWVAER